MILKYSSSFLSTLKKVNIRIKKSFRKHITTFEKNPYDPQLNNHPLKREFAGYRSINITADWRAVYKELSEGDERVAYFVLLGTHDQLYR